MTNKEQAASRSHEQRYAVRHILSFQPSPDIRLQADTENAIDEAVAEDIHQVRASLTRIAGLVGKQKTLDLISEEAVKIFKPL